MVGSSVPPSMRYTLARHLAKSRGLCDREAERLAREAVRRRG